MGRLYWPMCFYQHEEGLRPNVRPSAENLELFDQINDESS